VLFTEPTFLFLFLPVLLALYFAVPDRGRNWLLLTASVIFYAKGGGTFTFLIAGSIAFNYFAALAIDRNRGTSTGRWLLRGTVAGNLVVLAIFKYANFIADNVQRAPRAAGRASIGTPARTAPDRDLVLHLPRDLLRRRRPSARRVGAEAPG
jgi:D-alanyl-lipoteichoic acid acyltransferase DltB (MBOAT superfamily)